MKRLALPLVFLAIIVVGISLGVHFKKEEVQSMPGFNAWLARVQEEINRREYLPSLQTKDSRGNAFAEPVRHFANRAQNLRSYISPDGWRLEPRNPNGKSPWTWLYTLEGVSRSRHTTSFRRPDNKEITADADTVSIDRHILTEWYRNSRAGIEQGFTIAERPHGDGRLNLSANITTDLTVSSSSRDRIVFNDDRAAVLALGGLKVTDANDKVLDASFIYDNTRATLAISIDDHSAVYPITVDPVAATPNWSAESDQASAILGYSAASAGDVNGDGYDDVIVGAIYYDHGENDEGAAFVWYGSADGLGANGTPDTPDTNNADWMAESDQASAYFGYSVTSAGDVNGDGYDDVIVAAYLYDHGENNEGAAFVWYGSATGLGANGTSANADWTVESDQVSAYLGYAVSVASAGDVNGDGYDDVIVGSLYYDHGENNEGAAFVWYGSATGLGVNGTPVNYDWMAESDQAGAYFGYSAASAGDVDGDGYDDVIVGASMYDKGQNDEGAVFVWYGSDTGLGANGTPVNYDWMAESNQASAQFGLPVASAGDVDGDGYDDVIVGASMYDKGQNDEGAVFVWYGSDTGLGANGTPGNYDWMAESDQVSAYLGYALASAGDVNGDGYDEVIVSAITYDNGQNDEGAAFVWFGSASGPVASGTPANADWMAEPDQVAVYLGGRSGVASAGDVNGDGYDEVIVGAPYYSNGQANEGTAFLYYITTAATLSPADVEPASLGKDAVGPVNVSFTTQVSIPVNGKIVVTFPDGFVLDGVGADSGECSTMDGTFATTVSGQAVTIARSGGTVQAPDSEECTIQEVENPPDLGSGGAYQVKTATVTGAVIEQDTNVAADIFVECDDGNDSNNDACLNTFVAATCGDGFVRTGVEGCDDANADNTDDCLDTCVSSTCGDGYVQADVEECDDGNAINTDSCTTSCALAALATCGDGYVQSDEECDDGNSSNTDSCPTTCLNPSCGDGYAQADVEECDDGNTTDGDGCSGTCGYEIAGRDVAAANSGVAFDHLEPGQTVDLSAPDPRGNTSTLILKTQSLPATCWCLWRLHPEELGEFSDEEACQTQLNLVGTGSGNIAVSVDCGADGVGTYQQAITVQGTSSTDGAGGCSLVRQ